MTHVEQAIRDAVEKGGYRDGAIFHYAIDHNFVTVVPKGEPETVDGVDNSDLVYLAVIFLDPTFWQALGKARGWDGKTLVRRGAIIGNFVTPDHKPYAEMGFGMDYISTWCFHWHRFIDHLAEGKDAESFFASLSNNPKKECMNKDEVMDFLQQELDKIKRDEPYAHNAITSFEYVINAIGNL